MEYKNLITKKERGLGWITVNRPEKLNALNSDTIQELHDCFASFQQEACQIGLVNKVVSQKDPLPECEALAKEIASNGPLAVKYSIEAINQGLDRPLQEGLLLEAELFGKACMTADSKEGTKAFLEKRKANFMGN